MSIMRKNFEMNFFLSAVSVDLLLLRKSANTNSYKQVVTKYHNHVQPLLCYFVLLQFGYVLLLHMDFISYLALFML